MSLNENENPVHDPNTGMGKNLASEQLSTDNTDLPPVVEQQESKKENVAQFNGLSDEDYDKMDLESLCKTLEEFIKKHDVVTIKNEVEKIKTTFYQKYEIASEEAKNIFIQEGGEEKDFLYNNSTKKKFGALYFSYRDQKNQYYENLQSDLDKNLAARINLTEKLKSLVDSKDSLPKRIEVFNQIKEEWHEIGNIPRDNKNIIWNNFFHHADQFYKQIHIDREFRELDYKRNLEQKRNIIERAKVLALQTDNVSKAVRELHLLHKIWKEEIGPVSKEYRDPIWEEFIAISSKIHANKQAYLDAKNQILEDNLVKKNELIARIVALQEKNANSHKEWQAILKEKEEIHQAFIKVGAVPHEVKNDIWNTFRAAEKKLNQQKNQYYKASKQEYLENIRKKKTLIELAEAHKKDTDFETATPLFKQIQEDWKTIGYVPKKEGDILWKNFKEACNAYFDRLKEEKKEHLKIQKEAYNQKKTLLDVAKQRTYEKSSQVVALIGEWKKIGRVPYKNISIEDEFTVFLDELFSRIKLDRKQAEMLKFENKISQENPENKEQFLKKEINFIKRKISEIKSDILQLENNLSFFKHAKSDNPMIKDVHKKIDRRKEDVCNWKEKLQKAKKELHLFESSKNASEVENSTPAAKKD